jgi:GAF domain-containing protein
LEKLGAPQSWLGVPLLENDRALGLLSLSRNVERAFTAEERETARAFAQRIVEVFKREENNNNQSESNDSMGLAFMPAGQTPSRKMFDGRESIQAVMIPV